MDEYKQFNWLIRRKLGKYLRIILIKLFHNKSTAYIELSNICNAKCVFCSYPTILKTNKIFQNMEENTFYKAKKILIDSNIKRVSFTPTTGEIFINKNWHRYLQEILNLKKIKKVYFYSNAILLTEDNVNHILNLRYLNKLILYFSVGGLDRDTYKTLYGVDKYNIVEKNINYLLAKLKDNRCKIKVSIEFRMPKGYSWTKDSYFKFNRASYKYIKFRFMNTFDPIGNMIKPSSLITTNHSDFKKDYSPCYELKTIRYAADGSIWVCGCVTSELPGDESLKLGCITEDVNIIRLKQMKKISDWKQTNLIPIPCKICTLYRPHISLL